MNGLFEEYQTVPGARDPDIPGDEYLMIAWSKFIKGYDSSAKSLDSILWAVEKHWF